MKEAYEALDEVMAIVYYQTPPEVWGTIEDRIARVRRALKALAEVDGLRRELEAAKAREARLLARLNAIESAVVEAVATLTRGQKIGGGAL